MPEHVHLLMSEPPEMKLSGSFRALKTQTSKQLKVDRPRFWQLNYHDFNVFTRPKFTEKLRYIHRNPVSRGLVERPEDWPWSSFHHWQTGEQGRVTIESHWTWNARVDPNIPLIDQQWRSHERTQRVPRS
jgi:putative transposase